MISRFKEELLKKMYCIVLEVKVLELIEIKSKLFQNVKECGGKKKYMTLTSQSSENSFNNNINLGQMYAIPKTTSHYLINNKN